MPKIPKSAKKKIASEDELLWSFITKENILELDKLNDPTAEVGFFADLFGFNNWNSDLYQSIQLTFYHNLYTYAKENQFTPAQLSIFVSIMKVTLDKWIEVGFKNLNIIEEFKTLVLKNVKFQQDENSLDVSSSSGFSPDIAKLVIEYAAKTLFQHYHLFQYVFTNEQESDVVYVTRKLEFPVPAAPLQEAMPIAQYNEMKEAERKKREDDEAFNSNIDLFDALDPVEIKQVTLETVVGMVESIQLECEKVLQDHRTRQSNSVTKLTKETN